MTRRELIAEAKRVSAERGCCPEVAALLGQAMQAPESVRPAPDVEAIILDELPGYWGPDSAAADLARRVALRVIDAMKATKAEVLP